MVGEEVSAHAWKQEWLGLGIYEKNPGYEVINHWNRFAREVVEFWRFSSPIWRFSSPRQSGLVSLSFEQEDTSTLQVPSNVMVL